MVWIKTRWNGSFNCEKGSDYDLGRVAECSQCREMKRMYNYLKRKWAGTEGRFTRPKVCWDCLEEGGE